MSYYKINSIEANKAWDEYQAEAKALRDRCKAFAALFGGEPVMYGDPVRMGGIAFNGNVDSDLWIMFDKRRGYCQPRRKPRKGASPEVKVNLKANVERWTQGLPLKTVSFCPVYKAIGKNNSMDFIFSGLTIFRRGDWIYAKTGAEVIPMMTEILGSEFEEAYKAVQP